MAKEPKSTEHISGTSCGWVKGTLERCKTFNQPEFNSTEYRGALILASADLPAVRKLCGFKGHSAHRGCSKCFKFFPGSFKDKTDYSGFDRDLWPPRHNDSHRIHAEMVRKAPTQSKQEELATKYGVCYSCLLQLEYFDAIRFRVIDPMHNLFLGTLG